jgi:hypothetical protein
MLMTMILVRTARPSAIDLESIRSILSVDNVRGAGRQNDIFVTGTAATSRQMIAPVIAPALYVHDTE